MEIVSDGMGGGRNPNPNRDPLSTREILMRLDQVLSGAPLLLHDASRESIVRAWYDIEVGDELTAAYPALINQAIH